MAVSCNMMKKLRVITKQKKKMDRKQRAVRDTSSGSFMPILKNKKET